MKTIFKTLLICLTITAAVAFTTTSGGGGISKYDKYVNFSFPDSIGSSKTVLFPTATAIAPSYVSDSINLKVGEFYTIVTIPQLTAARRVKLSTQSYLTAGAQLVLDATADGTSRNLIVVQSTVSDTLSVQSKKRGTWIYTGTKWVPCGLF